MNIFGALPAATEPIKQIRLVANPLFVARIDHQVQVFLFQPRAAISVKAGGLLAKITLIL